MPPKLVSPLALFLVRGAGLLRALFALSNCARVARVFSSSIHVPQRPFFPISVNWSGFHLKSVVPQNLGSLHLFGNSTGFLIFFFTLELQSRPSLGKFGTAHARWTLLLCGALFVL